MKPLKIVISNAVHLFSAKINIILLGSLVLASCGGGGGTPTPPVKITPPKITASVSSLTATVGIAITPITIISTGGKVFLFTIKPATSNGLKFSIRTGVISGTPTTAAAQIDYNITTNNSKGSSTAKVSITVNKPVAPPMGLRGTGLNKSAVFVWDKHNNADSYKLYHASESFTDLDIVNYRSLMGFSEIAVADVNTVKQVIKGLDNITKTFFVVTAVKDGVESIASNEISLTPSALNDTGIIFAGNIPEINQAGTCIANAMGGVSDNIVEQQDCKNGRDAEAIAKTLIKVGAGSAGFDFTKLGKDGNELVIQDQTWVAGGMGAEAAGTKWACVRDNKTNLIWEVKTDEGMKDADTTDANDTNIHHKDNTYRWGGVGEQFSTPADAFVESAKDWDGLVNGSNDNNLCGLNSWHVPSRKELLTIVDYSDFGLDKNYFPNTTEAIYWTATPSAFYDVIGKEYHVWAVVLRDDFNGFIGDYIEYAGSHISVRLVHVGQ